jgi:hypothetical protein
VSIYKTAAILIGITIVGVGIYAYVRTVQTIKAL